MSKKPVVSTDDDAPGELDPGTPIAGPNLLLDSGAAWDRYKLPIVGGVLILVLALVGSEVYRSNKQKSAEAASAQLDSAKTKGEYQAVIDAYPTSLAAANAYLLIAQEQIEAKDYAGAASTWSTFAEKFPGHPQVPASLLARGEALESEGKLDEARAAFQQVATTYPKDYAAPMARMSEATLLKSQRKLEEARQVYENIVASYPDSIGALQSKDELRYLNALPPLGAPAPTPVPTPAPAPTPVATPVASAAPSAAPTVAPAANAPPK